jgi:hypothetical protein
MALSSVVAPLSANAASSTYKPPTVVVEGVEVLADGDYYLQILDKWVYPVVTNAVWVVLSDRKPDKPFTVSRVSYDKDRGPKYSITYDGKGIGVQSLEGVQLSSLYAPNWKISVYSGFCTIRDYTNQALLVTASGASSKNGTNIIVWTKKGSAPEHGKITFLTPEDAPEEDPIPILSPKEAPSGTPTKAADGWYRLKMDGETVWDMNGYADFDAKGYVEMRDRGSMETTYDGARTDNQKFYLKNMGKGQITLRTTDGKYLGIDGSIKDGAQVKKVDKSFLWNVNFSKVPGKEGNSNITYGGLRPSGNKDFVVAATLSMEEDDFLSDNYKVMEGSKIFMWSSPKTTPQNAGFAFIPVSVPASADWYKAPSSGSGGHTKSLTVGNMTLKVSNVYSMGANLNVPGKQDMGGYLMHMYFIVASTPGTIKITNSSKKSNNGEILYWPLNTIGFSNSLVPKPIYPDRDYAADYDDAEYLPLKQGTTSIANKAYYCVSYAEGKPIPGYPNGNYWSIQVFFVDATTAAKSVGTPKKYPAGEGTNGGTYVVFSVK